MASDLNKIGKYLNGLPPLDADPVMLQLLARTLMLELEEATEELRETTKSQDELVSTQIAYLDSGLGINKLAVLFLKARGITVRFFM